MPGVYCLLQAATDQYTDVCVLSDGLTVDLQHDRRLLRVTAGVGGLAAVDPGVLDDGVVNDKPGS